MTDSYLEHYGVKGMKWGVRNDKRAPIKEHRKKSREALQAKGLSKNQAKATARAQERIDAMRTVAKGQSKDIGLARRTANRMNSNQALSIGTALKHPFSTQKAANLQLRKNAANQKKMLNGEKRISAALIRMSNIDIGSLDFSIDSSSSGRSNSHGLTSSQSAAVERYLKSNGINANL